MSQKEATMKKTIVITSKPDKVLRDIALKHLHNQFGEIEIYKKGYLHFWKYGNQVFNPYVDPNANSVSFISAISKKVLQNTIHENAYIMAINYYRGDGPHYTIYYIQPSTLWKHYVKAKVDRRTGYKDTWHITIRHDKSYLVLIRKNKDDVVIPVDEDNYFTRYKMTEKEYNRFQSVLPIKNNPRPQQKTLKLFVQGNQGYETFSSISARAIAILSILTKSKKFIDIENVYSNLRNYEIAVDSHHKVQYVIDKLIEIGAIEVKDQRLYGLAKNIKADIILGS